jgi:ABC-type nitrate/sulfonate/bicarbonate transport system permease component
LSRRAVLGTLSLAGVPIAWEIAARLGLIDTRLLSYPSDVLAAAINEVQKPRFWVDVRVSAFEFVVGYVLAIFVGVGFGIVIGWYRRLFYLLEPAINFLYAIPRIALLPMIILWLGLGVWSKVAVVFLGASVTILLNTLHGVRTVDGRLLAVADVFGASRTRVFTSVVLPGSIPFILAGLRLGVGRALIGVIVGELYGSSVGLGVMISIAGNNLQVNRVLFGTLLFIILGLVSVEAIRRIEHRFATWRQDLSMLA